MRSIVVANQKGGCAKTTTIVNLAACFAQKGGKVLIIDLDPQANTTNWLGAGDPPDGAFRLFVSDESVGNLIGQSSLDNISLIAASQHLSSVERALAGKIAIDTILKRRLDSLDPNYWDYILIDTPPTLGLLTLNALAYAKELLVPVTTHILTLSGVAQLMSTVENVKNILNPDLRVLGFVPSRVDQRTRHSKEVLDLLVEEFGELVMKSGIRESVRLAESPSFNQSILSYDNTSGASKDFQALANEIIQRRQKGV